MLADRKLQVGAIGTTVRIVPGRQLGFALSHALGAIGEDDRATLVSELLEAAHQVGNLYADPYWAAHRQE